MINIEPNNQIETVLNLEYLTSLMGGKTHLIKKIMDTFLVQVKEELKSINVAILTTDYINIKNLAHTMRSSVSIMGISTVLPVLQEMEDLGTGVTCLDIDRNEKLIALNLNLNTICKKAFIEIENYSFS